MTHSPEPWTTYTVVGQTGIRDGKGLPLVHAADEMSKPDAKRIVACVNACKGIPTEDLAQIWEHGGFEFLSQQILDSNARETEQTVRRTH